MYFACDYCEQKFVNKANYTKHFCEMKKKTLLLQTKIGRSALFAYKFWRKELGHKVTEDSTYLESRYFKSFINFVEFCNEKMIPDRFGFIKLMIAHQISPLHWSGKMYHEFYMEKFDSLYSPLKQVEMSLDYLTKLSDVFKCDKNIALKQLEPIQLMRLISARKLSPWLLMFMKSFQDILKYDLKGENKILMESVLAPKDWIQKFQNDPNITKKIKGVITDLNI